VVSQNRHFSQSNRNQGIVIMIGRILLAYDGSDNGKRAIGVAAELSLKLKADLYIVHVLLHGRPAKELGHLVEVLWLVAQAEKALSPPIAVASDQIYDVLGQIEPDGQCARMISAMGDLLVFYAQTSSEKQGAKVIKALVRVGDYADEILETAQELGVDLIVIGARGLGKVRGPVLGSVSQKILHSAEQTVVAVK
jgi:nucleotide-binding universal stress UspA family protein